MNSWSEKGAMIWKPTVGGVFITQPSLHRKWAEVGLSGVEHRGPTSGCAYARYPCSRHLNWVLKMRGLQNGFCVVCLKTKRGCPPNKRHTQIHKPLPLDSPDVMFWGQWLPLPLQPAQGLELDPASPGEAHEPVLELRNRSLAIRSLPQTIPWLPNGPRNGRFY